MRDRSALTAMAATAVLALAPAALAQPPQDALPAILHLQVDQHPAWRAYKDALAEQRAEGSGDLAAAARLNGLSTPERLAALRTQLKVGEEEFERQAVATEAFYSALSPDQRRIFDDVTRTPVPPTPMRAIGRQTVRSNDAPAAYTLRQPPFSDGLPPPTP